MPPTGLFGGYMEPHRLIRPTIFKTVLDIKRNTQVYTLESSGRLVSNGQDIEELNGAQRNELVLPGQNQ